MRQYFRKHFFYLTILLVIVFVGTVSFYRFIIKHDYVVGYQGSCDPVSGKCFKSCEDDACTKIDYYSEMQKYEPDLFRECGKDITNCAAANTCLSGDRNCSVTYCDKNTSDNDNVCQEPIVKQPNVQNDNQIKP